MSIWENFDKCPVCGSEYASYYGTGQAPVFQFDDILDGLPLAVQISYVVCAGCGLIYQPRHMTEKAMSEFYASGTYRKSLSRPVADLDASELRTVDKILPHITPNGSHLDVGCSRGFLLAASREKLGNKVFGVEPFADWVSEDVQTVRSLADVRGQFDTVSSIHSYEHMLDPLLAAAQMISLVKPGGRLVLEVPSEQSPGGWMRLPHTYCFQPWVIMRIFGGLELVKFELNPHNFFIFRKPEGSQYEVSAWQRSTVTQP